MTLKHTSKCCNTVLFISTLQMSIAVVCLYIKFDFSRCLLHVIPSHYTQLSVIDMNWSRIYLYIDRFHPIVESPLNKKNSVLSQWRRPYGLLKSQWCIHNMTPCCQPFFLNNFSNQLILSSKMTFARITSNWTVMYNVLSRCNVSRTQQNHSQHQPWFIVTLLLSTSNICEERAEFARVRQMA